ncbi:hypothetical protein D9M70_643660 [compost metagenome]
MRRFLIAFKALLAISAPSMVKILPLNSEVNTSLTKRAMPSMAFRVTLPTKPSHTTRSTVPLKISLPSTLPWKFSAPRSWSACSSLLVSLTC